MIAIDAAHLHQDIDAGTVQLLARDQLHPGHFAPPVSRHPRTQQVQDLGFRDAIVLGDAGRPHHEGQCVGIGAAIVFAMRRNERFGLAHANVFGLDRGERARIDHVDRPSRREDVRPPIGLAHGPRLGPAALQRLHDASHLSRGGIEQRGEPVGAGERGEAVRRDAAKTRLQRLKRRGPLQHGGDQFAGFVPRLHAAEGLQGVPEIVAKHAGHHRCQDVPLGRLTEDLAAPGRVGALQIAEMTVQGNQQILHRDGNHVQAKRPVHPGRDDVLA